MLKTIRLAKNLLFAKAKDVEVGSNDSGNDNVDKMIKRLPLTSKNLNEVKGYLTPNAKQAFT